jgi:hypothetical protein
MMSWFECWFWRPSRQRFSTSRPVWELNFCRHDELKWHNPMPLKITWPGDALFGELYGH